MLFQLKADCHLINIHFGLTRKFFEDLFDPDESSVDLKNLESLIESEYKHRSTIEFSKPNSCIFVAELVSSAKFIHRFH
ncbi:hypothetical protein DERF_009179 [Dermatophagoides farinae]|uniref:Uncharacterized protein n=1 Tax=Dermatophagoides farinae TaxID=6954 RepID=A0A922L0J5_DERFA|nr:hypothetical protein DERF_009179 [Dermatophagoides farinae]